jgi:tRNA nucleotidyltransferase (CCA-adding enzyme)
MLDGVPAREDALMEIPAPSELMARVGALPAAPVLLERVGDRRGVHLVGGAVRDLLLGHVSPDLDLVVEGDVAQLVGLLGGEIRTYDRFGTATVSLDGHMFDVARARSETYAHPGALPDVEPARLADDLKRRDFTINAAAIELGGQFAGAFRAVPFTLEDLEARRLRVLHDASFIDDPTRLLRLVRYQARLGFEIEPHTLELAREAISGGALGTVSGPRIGAELRLLAGERDPVAALEALAALGLGLTEGFGVRDATVARHALELLPSDGEPGRLVLGEASQGVDSSRLAGWLDRLAFSAPARETIVAVATRAAALADALRTAGAPSEIAAVVGDAGPELVALAGASGAEPEATEWLERWRHVRLEIDGADLLAAGIAEGPAIGRGLRAALAAKLDGLLDGHDAELAAALAAAR